MKAFLYGVGLQFKMDIRSKTMLITCYLVPLVFFFFMSGIMLSGIMFPATMLPDFIKNKIAEIAI